MDYLNFSYTPKKSSSGAPEYFHYSAKPYDSKATFDHILAVNGKKKVGNKKVEKKGNGDEDLDFQTLFTSLSNFSFNETDEPRFKETLPNNDVKEPVLSNEQDILTKYVKSAKEKNEVNINVDRETLLTDDEKDNFRRAVAEFLRVDPTEVSLQNFDSSSTQIIVKVGTEVEIGNDGINAVLDLARKFGLEVKSYYKSNSFNRNPPSDDVEYITLDLGDDAEAQCSIEEKLDTVSKALDETNKLSERLQAITGTISTRCLYRLDVIQNLKRFSTSITRARTIANTCVNSNKFYSCIQNTMQELATASLSLDEIKKITDECNEQLLKEYELRYYQRIINNSKFYAKKLASASYDNLQAAKDYVAEVVTSLLELIKNFFIAVSDFVKKYASSIAAAGALIVKLSYQVTNGGLFNALLSSVTDPVAVMSIGYLIFKICNQISELTTADYQKIYGIMKISYNLYTGKNIGDVTTVSFTENALKSSLLAIKHFARWLAPDRIKPEDYYSNAKQLVTSWSGKNTADINGTDYKLYNDRLNEQFDKLIKMSETDLRKITPEQFKQDFDILLKWAGPLSVFLQKAYGSRSAVEKGKVKKQMKQQNKVQTYGLRELLAAINNNNLYPDVVNPVARERLKTWYAFRTNRKLFESDYTPEQLKMLEQMRLYELDPTYSDLIDNFFTYVNLKTKLQDLHIQTINSLRYAHAIDKFIVGKFGNYVIPWTIPNYHIPITNIDPFSDAECGDKISNEIGVLDVLKIQLQRLINSQRELIASKSPYDSPLPLPEPPVSIVQTDFFRRNAGDSYILSWPSWRFMDLDQKTSLLSYHFSSPDKYVKIPKLVVLEPINESDWRILIGNVMSGREFTIPQPLKDVVVFVDETALINRSRGK
jgi:hypothetical protein